MSQGRPAKTLAIAVVLLGSAGLVVVSIWFSLQLFVNPNSVSWINVLLPGWIKISATDQNSPQTLSQIRNSLSQQGQSAGEPLSVETDPQSLQPISLVLPVLSRQSQCQCQPVLELRLYKFFSTQHSKTYYQLVSQLPVEGPEESLVISPLVDAETADYGSTRPLPLTELHRFSSTTPTPGKWFYLVGYRQQGRVAIAYGQVVHYNPSRDRLNLMLAWTSPTGQVPQWQQVTGDSTPELVLDQTIDLEPQLRVYQVKPAAFFFNPIQLETISLVEPALDDFAYQQAIFLGRSGLWSPAWKWLQFIQQQRQQTWTEAAQAQMDLIRLSAQSTQNQATKTWASPSQQVLVNIIDGRWGEALQVFQESAENTPEVITLLETDTGQLWNRVTAALRVNPDRPEVKAWGTLILAVQQGEEEAIAWLRQQPQTTTADLSYIQTLLSHLEGNSSSPKTLSSQFTRYVPLLSQ